MVSVGVILNVAIREGLPKDLAFKRYLDTMREEMVEIWEKPIPGRENSKSQCPVVGMGLGYLRSNKIPVWIEGVEIGDCIKRCG